MNMTVDFDVIVLGGGNAGMGAAGVARDAGKRVAMIEARELGGTCPLRGCVPKKVLVAAAETLEAIARAGEHGIEVGPATLDWPALIARKQTFVEGVPEQFATSMTKRGIEVIDGAARFVAPDAIEVNGRTLTADAFVVATGSAPRVLELPGAEHLIDSEAFLDLPERPASIVFVGGGVIAFEFAHVLVRAGTRVTILEVAPTPLGNLDGDAVAELVRVSGELGIEVICGAHLGAVSRTDTGFEVSFSADGASRTIECALAMNGAGRVAALGALDLAAADVKLSGPRPVVDTHLRSTSNQRVWFAGDAAMGTPQLSPVATYEGKLVGHNLVHPDDLRSPSYREVPSAVYTVPTLAQVGHTEATATEAGLAFDVKTNDMSTWRSARTYAERAAFSKVLVERETGAILGAVILGHGAAEIIGVFADAVARGVTATELKERIYAYPTMSSDIKYLV
jgi:glutathione reductase (NADPH)